jgi:hypothetical protein
VGHKPAVEEKDDVCLTHETLCREVGACKKYEAAEVNECIGCLEYDEKEDVCNFNNEEQAPLKKDVKNCYHKVIAETILSEKKGKGDKIDVPKMKAAPEEERIKEIGVGGDILCESDVFSNEYITSSLMSGAEKIIIYRKHQGKTVKYTIEVQDGD